MQEQNAELQDIIDSYENVENDMRELKELIQTGYEMNAKYRKMNQEYKQMKKDFGRDMNKLFIRSKWRF